MTLLTFEHVHFAYGNRPVLADVTFAISPGEVVALLGRNGAGKTTLTRLAVALAHPNRGTVWVDRTETHGRQPEDLADRVAYLFQHPERQFFARTVLDEVTFAPLQLGCGVAEARGRARAALAAVGLEPEEQSHPHDLSPAQRKLLGLAAAAAQTDRLLVLDEPTQGFDRATRARAGSVLRAHAARGGGVLVVTHDLAFVADWCDRALALGEGHLRYEGPAHRVVGDARLADSLGLRVPPTVALSRALALPGAPVRHADIADALSARCRGG